MAHLGNSSSQVVEDLICRAQRNTILSPSRYCSSLLDWGRQLGLSLSNPPPTPLPQGVVDFIAALTAKGQVTVYTDGSFELVRVPLLSALTLSKTDQTAHYGRGATGIYVPPSASHPAIALQLTTPLGRATDAYYQELLGTAMGALMVQHTPINAYSDCQAAIRRFRHASNPLGASIGHLQYGPLLHGIRQLMLPSEMGHALQWTKAHPERFKPRLDWTADDQGIYMADLVAGELTTLHREIQITTFTADADSLLNALVPAGQWVWITGSQLFTGSLRHSMQRLHYLEYLVNRDNNRQLRAAAPRWTHNSVALMVTLTHAKGRRSSRARGRLVSHLYDWMAHESNLAKGTNETHRESAATCPLCGTAATQAHINTSCCHPAMQDLRILHKRDIDMHFLSFRYTVLPAAQRWIALLMNYAETHLWEDSERAGDIWNGRWSHQLIADTMIEHTDAEIPPKEYTSAIQWLANLTLTLQKKNTDYVIFHATANPAATGAAPGTNEYYT